MLVPPETLVGLGSVMLSAAPTLAAVGHKVDAEGVPSAEGEGGRLGEGEVAEDTTLVLPHAKEARQATTRTTERDTAERS